MIQQQQLLRSLPGIGPVWAPTLLAEILPVFHPELPHGAKKRVAAAGLDVRQHDSGESTGKGKMSKRGSKYLRTAIMQAAEMAIFTAHDPLFSATFLVVPIMLLGFTALSLDISTNRPTWCRRATWTTVRVPKILKG